MAEFQEVAKMYDRLCDSYDECYKCPMFRNRNGNNPIGCGYWTLKVDPETAEEIILRWGKEHPIMTNRMKFKEVFGFEFTDRVPESQYHREWLDAEYKGEQDDNT